MFVEVTRSFILLLCDSSSLSAMADCAKCLKSIPRSGKNASKVDCADCKSSFHGKCVDLTPDDIQYYQDSENIWRCASCSIERRKSMAIESRPESSSTMTYDDVYNLVSEIKKDMKVMEANLGKSIDSAFEELQETKSLVTKQSNEISALLELINNLTSENTELKSKVSILESRMEDIEQYSRRDTIEIHGIPVKTDEQVVEVVKSVGRALDITIDESMISACHRLRSRPAKPVKPGQVEVKKHPGIIVKMTRRMDAEAVLEKRRVKRNLSTHSIGLTESPAEVIYINESLCPGRRQLLNDAREIKKKKQYTYLWIRGGKILMRKSEGDPVIVVQTRSDLDKL